VNGYIPSILHVTHEAAHHLGGIGTVLQGLLTSPSYHAGVGRSIKVGPLWERGPVENPDSRLGVGGRVLYSSLDDVHDDEFDARFHPIEERYNVRIVYGVRTIDAPDEDDPSAEAEVALIDVSQMWIGRVNDVKGRLFDWCGLESNRHEHSDDYEQWVRLAAPACDVAMALLKPNEFPCLVLSHEYMGMPTALWATMDLAGRFRTALHAHECATARSLVESHPAHDAAFYPAMRRALAKGQSMDEVFGDQSHNYRHELVRRAHRLDVTLAVGDATADEMRFLDHAMHHADVRVCYNGVPHEKTSPEREIASRDRVNQWLTNVLGAPPDWLLTHVARPVASKGLWRDIELLREMAPALEAEGKTAAYVLLTCGARPRTVEDVTRMAGEYEWPRRHRTGYPDLSGPEIDLARDIDAFNRDFKGDPITCILVNQWGFNRQTLGAAAPEDLTLADLRRAADVELGLSVYEPFGIAPLEPLHAGTICVVTELSGCAAFARDAARACACDASPNVIFADFTRHDRIDSLALTRADLTAIERATIPQIAHEIVAALPRSDADRQRLLNQGVALAGEMQWERVVAEMFLPALRDAMREEPARIAV
jgi:hypothetical protein